MHARECEQISSDGRGIHRYYTQRRFFAVRPPALSSALFSHLFTVISSTACHPTPRIYHSATQCTKSRLKSGVKSPFLATSIGSFSKTLWKMYRNTLFIGITLFSTFYLSLYESDTMHRKEWRQSINSISYTGKSSIMSTRSTKKTPNSVR